MHTEDHNFFVDLVVGYRKAKTVFAAHELGIFLALETEPMAAEALAAKLGYDARALTLVLHALTSFGLLTHEEGHFRNTERASRHLVPGRAGYAGNNIAFQNLIWDAWGALEETVKKGQPSAPLLGLLGDRNQDFTREYVRGMEVIAARPAAVIASLLTEAKPVTHMLDVGCGPATYARAMLEKNASARATLLDLTTTLEITRELWANSPLAQRVTFTAGDYTKVALGKSEFDLVLMSHITHNESPETNASLAMSAFAALETGGRIAIHDFVVNDDGCSPTFSTLFSVNMLVYTKGGKVYTRAEYAEMLRAAGFRNVMVQEMSVGSIDNPTALIVGEK